MPDASAQASAGSSDVAPEINQPGLRELREAVANRLWRPFEKPAHLRRDAVAGLNTAINNVPDGMANGVLVGVNPLYGLYANLVGPIVGGALSSARLMMITTTAAASLTAGQALAPLPLNRRENAMFVMVILIGVFQLAFGLMRLGRFTRFVSYSVTTGFLAGIAVLLILSQLPTIAGATVSGSNRVLQTLFLLSHLERVSLESVSMGVLALVLAVLLPKTKLGNLGRLVAIVIPSLMVAALAIDGVSVVDDVGDIPGGVPMPFLPSFFAAIGLFTGAASVAAITLVQGAGVSQSVPNPDGSRISASRDFIAQGAANLVSGFFRGLPVGGSLSSTALHVMSGATSRWASIFAGLWMIAIVVIAPDLVERVAMPALGALLVLAGARSLKPDEMRLVWRAGWPSRLAGVTTFVSTLVLPIQAAVGIGVVISALLFMNRSSIDVAVVELVQRSDGLIEEREGPERLPSREVTVLDVYGHLFYAGARTLEELLPRPRGAEQPVVVLRLRGRTSLGATLIDILDDYARELAAAGGRLYLSGVSRDAHRQIERSGKLRLERSVRAYRATPVIGQSTNEARGDAEEWLVSARDAKKEN